MRRKLLTIASGAEHDVGVMWWNLSNFGSVVEAHVRHEIPHAPVAEKRVVALFDTHNKDSHDGHKQSHGYESQRTA